MNIDGLEIEVERKPIKNMHLSVYPPDGRVHLSIPRYLSDGDVLSFIASKWEWIQKHREEVINQARQTKREYVSGENHYLFGVRYRLQVVNTTSGANSVEVQGDRLIMKSRQTSTMEKREEIMQEWYRTQLKRYLDALVNEWAAKLEEPKVTWGIKRMKREWGSCGAKKRILLFNLELARVPKRCIEYVVVHELTHLKVQNHSKIFKALMTQRLPDWHNRRQELNSFIALTV